MSTYIQMVIIIFMSILREKKHAVLFGLETPFKPLHKTQENDLNSRHPNSTWGQRGSWQTLKYAPSVQWTPRFFFYYSLWQAFLLQYLKYSADGIF